jgi:shikimate dehydrogenase
VKRLAVIGHPVGHSRSPAMQTAALNALGLAGEWTYEAIAVPPADFAELTRTLPDEGFVGANVTIPHKEAALAIAGDASAAANEIGAANTLSFTEAGIRADNTDAPGLLAALAVHPAEKRSLVLGAGGSARAAVWALAGQGARVEVWNRTRARAEELASSIRRFVGEAGTIAVVSADQAAATDYELIVNCTSVGMPDSAGGAFEQLPLRADRLGGAIVVDLVYGGGETELVSAARAAGAGVVDGLEVLVRQGAESLRIWTGREPPLDVMRRAAAGV